MSCKSSMMLYWPNKYGNWHHIMTLFFRFFKDNFFPNGSIFDAKENKGSYTWKNILKGRDIIRSGYEMENWWWMLSPNFYQDRWLPAPKHGSIISPILDITLDATVSILIDHDLCN